MSAWLVDTVLYTGLLIGLVLVLRRPVGKFFGPQLAYSLWALPFLRLLLPPIVLPASLAPEPVRATAMRAAESAPAAIEVPAETAAAPVDFAATPPPAWEWADLIAPAVSVWAGVALVFLIFRIATYHRMRRELLKGARPVGEIGRIRMVETPALAAPVAFGVLDKVIALPPLFMAQPAIAERDLAIAHEFAHHQGHDLLANFAAQALLALHWFNPLAWYGWRAMRRDQEAACDARVLAGRGREERLRYAALIAGIATGPRSIAFERALAASMACPVLGERSIVHRLRSLSMSEMSRRRRWFGRSLFAASALALPLTASISYAAANAQPAAPEPPAAPSLVIAPLPPAPPEAPEAPVAGGFHGLTVHGDGPQPPQFDGHAARDSEELQAEMEKLQREMEQFGEKWAQDWEKYGEEWARWGEQYGAHVAEHARRNAPEVVVSCDDGADQPVRTSHTADGRPLIQICERDMHRLAHSSLRNARNSIAGNREMSEEVRREVLRDLDEEIANLERESD